MDCKNLKTIIIPDGTISIGAGAFVSSSVESITIPNSVTSISESAFQTCLNLAEFICQYATEDRRSLIMDKVLVSVAAAGLTSYDIPDGVTKIGLGAFFNRKSIVSVTIPNTVTVIDGYAFQGCSSLANITIPEMVTKISSKAFGNCSSLMDITIPEAVTTVGYEAFYGCSTLTSVYCQSATPPTLGSRTFDGNAENRKIYVPAESVSAYKSASGWSTYADAIVAEPGYQIGDLVTVNGVQGIVFQTSPVKIVSVLETSAAWSTENVTTTATNENDGSVNMAIIKAISGWESKYPAFKWCADLGEGWYLPAYNELVTIYNQKATLNSVLEVQNLAKFSGNWHWASTEYNYNYACFVDFSSGKVYYSNNKNSKTIVRAVYTF